MHFPALHARLHDNAADLDGTVAAPIPVYLTHACPIVRAGLAAILAPHAAFAVVEARCPRDFSAASIIITDYAAGLHAAAQAWQQAPGHAPRVLVMTHHYKEWEVQRAVSSGVNGYLLQGCTAEELVRCVQLLGRGIDYLSATAGRSVVDSLGREPLTPRELDVLQVLAQGGSDKEIARTLGIGAGTVKSHIKHLLAKLDASARTHAVVVAMRRGLLSEGGADAPLLLKAAPCVPAWPRAARTHAGPVQR
jgi:DNA-binding NarL/FixJ family response regulator